MSEWISVKDRLPDLGAQVDVLIENGRRKIDCIHVGGGDFTDSDGYFFVARITHWQPLPAPPVQTALKDGVPCGHRGCLNHITHPCEGCGRIAGKSPKPAPPEGV